MKNKGQDWERWYATFLDPSRVTELAEKHRRSPHLTADDYFEGKRIELARELEDKQLIYLDTNHWVNLCNVMVQSSKLIPAYHDILGLLETLRGRGRICCPVSGGLFRELMKQGDRSTRGKTARIMDYLSGGVCLQNWLELIRWEFAKHIGRTFRIRRIEEAPFQTWTKVGYWAGDRIHKFPELPANDSTVMGKIFVDLWWEMTCEEYQAMPDWTPPPDEFSKEWVTQGERSRIARIHENERFADVLRVRRSELLLDLAPILYPLHAHCQGQPGSPDEHVAAVWNPIYAGNDLQLLPSVEVVAALDAAISLDTARKVQGNDMEDYTHAAQAIPYCDAFFCDNFMAQKVCNKPLELGKNFDTRIGSRPEEIITYLKELI